jgi:hypothetical protein
MSADVDDALRKLQKAIAELKLHLAMPAYATKPGKQTAILVHFLNRTLQMSEASGLLAGTRLGTPLVALMRVICEDLFLCFWAAQSEKNAEEYEHSISSELLRLVRVMLVNERGMVRHTATHEDVTASILKQLKDVKTDRIKIEQLAMKLGLSRLYDMLYRYPSLEAHGKAFGLPSPSQEEGIFAMLSSVVVLVNAIRLVSDNAVLENRPTTAIELLTFIGIEDIPGK